jgi:hypothetical protein
MKRIRAPLRRGVTVSSTALKAHLGLKRGLLGKLTALPLGSTFLSRRRGSSPRCDLPPAEALPQERRLSIPRGFSEQSACKESWVVTGEPEAESFEGGLRFLR